jgi:hypothetical protein
MRRRGQMEMIGLVFVVVLLVLGIVLYLAFAGKTRSPTTARQVQESNSFLTAIADTHIPACKVKFSEVAQSCAGGGFLPCSNPCVELDFAVDRIANATLLREGRKYNLSLVGKDVMNYSDCESADPKTLITSAPQLAIVLGGGRVKQLSLAYCR